MGQVDAVVPTRKSVLLQTGCVDLLRRLVSHRRPALFRGRHFEDVVIVLCVRWYLRYSLSYRDLQEMLAQRGLSIDHVTIWLRGQRHATRRSVSMALYTANDHTAA